MSKLIVTHIRPDFDACTSVWLVKRYYPRFALADVVFLPAGDTYRNEPADSNPKVLHVDTGLGKFDHHQFRERLSAAFRIYEYLKTVRKFSQFEAEALERMVELTTLIDNFEEVYFDNPTADIYELSIVQILEGIKIREANDHAVLEFMETALNGLLEILKRKIMAEAELAQAEVFKVKQYKCLVIRSKSKEASKLAEKSGYHLVLLQDPERGNVNMRVHPKAKFNLDKIYQAISLKEGSDKWFYHASGHLLLNGSSSHPQPATKLSLRTLMEIIRKNL